MDVKSIFELEASAFPNAWNQIKDSVPDGNGSPVLVLPGYDTKDTITTGLRQALDKKGSTSFSSGLSENVRFDFSAKHIKMIADQLHAIYEKTDQPIVIVGYSAGGIIARQFATLFPEKIRHIVTISSDFKTLEKTTVGEHSLKQFVNEIQNLNPKHARNAAQRMILPPAKPVTSIFIANGQDQFFPNGLSMNKPEWDHTENIYIFANNAQSTDHNGHYIPPIHQTMPVNATVIACACDRAALTLGGWRKMDPEEITKYGPQNVLSSLCNG